MGILEHVYDPFKAVNNIFKMLKKDGIIFGFAPYLYYYHAPNDLNFQDYFREFIVHYRFLVEIVVKSLIFFEF